MFSKFFIERPVFASVVSIIIVIAGVISAITSAVEEYPQLTPPQIVVRATYSGADAQTIADSVAAPLENAINGVENMIYMQSTSSSAGELNINVFFEIGTDPADARVNVNNRVAPALNTLPDEVRRYGLSVYERSGSLLELLTFYDPSNEMDRIEMNNYVKINIVEELKRVEGVGEAFAMVRNYAMRIWLNPELLHKYNLTASEVIAAIGEQNSQRTAGKIGQQPNDMGNPYVFAIRPEGRLKTVEQFENIIIRSDDKGSFLRVKDVARVELGADDYSIQGKYNGHSMVPLMIFLKNGANALATVERVNKKVEELSKNFPGNLTYSVGYDTTKFVAVSVKEVMKTFAEALLFVIFIMYMFLGNFRSTFITMLAVPVSICGAFIGIHLLGFSINLITLFALVLAIGIVVDDAIIVIENVERILHEERHLSVKEATIKAMREITSPVISIVLVLSAVFIPIAFMGGFTGVIQKQFALTLVASVAFSGFVALTLTPSLCALILRKKEGEPFWLVKKYNEFFDFSTRIFTAGVAKVLRHVIPSLLIVAVFMGLVVALFKATPGALVPNEDKGAVLTMVNLPSAMTLGHTQQTTNFIKSIVEQNPNVEAVTEIAGYDMISGSMKENGGAMFMMLKDWDKRKGYENSNFAMANELNGKLYFADRNSMTYVVTPPPINGLSLTGGFELYAQSLTGKTYHEIEADMQRVAAKANAHPMLNLVRTTLDTQFPQYTLTMNTEKIKMMGININDIFSTLSATIGKYYVNDFNLLGKNFRVYIRADQEYRTSPEDIKFLYVRSKTGHLVPLDALVSLQRSLGPDTVDRFNGFSAAKLMGEPKPGFTSGQAIQAIQEVMKEELGDEYSIGWSGSAYQEVAATGKGAQAFIFGLIFVFLILAAQYERWLMPLAVLTAVPFSVFGALLFNWARGLNNDIYFQIGLLLLIGLAAKNAILIVEFAMQQHLHNNRSITEAAIEAARMRFRPICMTSLAFTLGVFPMVIATGAGAASRHAIGTGVMGGMIAASTIAIFFVPLFFYLLESFNEWIDKKRAENKSAEDE
ncbi:MAG: multidrug efflux RND transporter permease subunit [Campylobacter sp.]|nr:multidrug efflux RND transporter permease subunit [Campylobacter sp.]